MTNARDRRSQERNRTTTRSRHCMCSDDTDISGSWYISRKETPILAEDQATDTGDESVVVVVLVIWGMIEWQDLLLLLWLTKTTPFPQCCIEKAKKDYCTDLEIDSCSQLYVDIFVAQDYISGCSRHPCGEAKTSQFTQNGKESRTGKPGDEENQSHGNARKW
jgi:hypothetical protein